MPFADHKKYKIQREELPAVPHFSDFSDPRFCGTNNKQKNGILAYYQWLHCIGNWGEEHSMCKKMRWYVERMMQEVWLEKWEEKRALGHFDHVILYGVKPWKEFEPLYQPVKKNRKGAYEFWLDRDFEPLYDADAADFREKAPILHDVFVKESSYGLTTFSPSGKLVQIEYATTAANMGTTALGVKAMDGVIIAAEKKTTSPLVDSSTVHKVFVLDEHVGCTYSGIGPDCRVLVDAARRECQGYRLTYHEPMPVGQLVRKISSLFQEFTQSGGVRPFGCSLLVAGVDCRGHHLYQVDPSGTFWAWKATSIGKGSIEAKTFLEKRYANEMEIEDAVHTALLTLKEGFDGKMTAENTQVGRVSGGKFELLSVGQLKDYLDQI